MPTQHPRVQVTLERTLYRAVSALARQDGVSMSLKARDLIREALDRLEDVALGAIVEERSRHPAKPLNRKALERRLDRG